MERNEKKMTYDLGLEWRLHLPVLHLLPVDSSEELVAADVRLAGVAAAQTLGGVLRQEL